jgi:hypothetical protein
VKFLRSIEFWLWMLVLLGVSLRLREFFASRSLWLDEVALLLQIKRRSYERLLLDGPGGNQGAPAAYLMLSKMALHYFSSLEVGARIVSLLCGIGAMFLTGWLVIVSFRDNLTRILGLLLIATSPWLVYYSAEGKQYMQEVLLALAVVSVSIRYEQRRTSLGIFALFGVVAVWFSHSACVVLCACGALQIMRAVSRGEKTRAIALVSVSVAWAASFAVHASTTMHALFGNRALMLYWGHGLAPWRKGVSSVALWIVEIWGSLMEYIFIPARLFALRELDASWWGIAWQGGLCCVVLLGIVRMFRERSPLAPYVALILCIAFMLALFRFAPLSSRLVLYTAPFIVVSAARGVAFLVEGARGQGTLMRMGALGAALLVVAPSVASSTAGALKPLDRNNIKGALRYLSAERAPQDLVVMRRADATVAALYTRRDRSLAMPFLVSNWKITKPKGMCARLKRELAATTPGGQVWIVGVLQADELSHAIDELARTCFVETHRVAEEGFIAARLRPR